MRLQDKAAGVITTEMRGRRLVDTVKRTIDGNLPNLTDFDSINLAFSTIDQRLSDGTLFLKKFELAAALLLSDPSIAGPASEKLDLGHTDTTQLSGSEFTRNLQAYFNRYCPSGGHILTTCVYADGAKVDSGWFQSWHPISITFGEVDREVRMQKQGWTILGYVHMGARACTRHRPDSLRLC
jgi:hypothetical protein